MSNSNNKIVFASILGAILATGLLALNPSPIIKDAGAQMYKDEFDYQHNSDYYQEGDYQYGNDDRSYYNQDYNKYSYNEYSYDDDNSKVQLEFADKYGDNYHKDYSKHPTKDHKFVCKTGQFEGFFVKSPDVCDLEIPEGPEGPQGPMGLPGVDGEDGQDGAQGPAGITILNATNIYKVVGPTNIFPENSPSAFFGASAECDDGDVALDGRYMYLTNNPGAHTRDAGTNTGIAESDIPDRYGATIAFPHPFDSISVTVFCFDNPPLRP